MVSLPEKSRWTASPDRRRPSGADEGGDPRSGSGRADPCFCCDCSKTTPVQQTRSWQLPARFCLSALPSCPGRCFARRPGDALRRPLKQKGSGSRSRSRKADDGQIIKEKTEETIGRIPYRKGHNARPLNTKTPPDPFTGTDGVSCGRSGKHFPPRRGTFAFPKAERRGTQAGDGACRPGPENATDEDRQSPRAAASRSPPRPREPLRSPARASRQTPETSSARCCTGGWKALPP